MMNYLELAERVAVTAGDLLTKYTLTFANKANEGLPPETIWDHLLGSLIRESLFKESGIPAFSEEVDDPEQRSRLGRLWWVDPIDGTRCFKAREPTYGVSVGMVVNNRPVLGVLYQPDPSRRRLYSALEKEGAYAKAPSAGTSKRIHVSKRTKTKIIGTLGTSDIDKLRGFYDYLKINCSSPSGVFTSKLIMIATRETDLYVKLTDKCNEWDTCAVEVILTEAGGRLTDIENKPLHYNKENPKHSNGIIASNGYDHDRVIELLQQYLQDHNNSRR